jgi:hypothetical protein
MVIRLFIDKEEYIYILYISWFVLVLQKYIILQLYIPQ